jgi:hypothetical protein
MIEKSEREYKFIIRDKYQSTWREKQLEMWFKLQTPKLALVDRELRCKKKTKNKEQLSIAKMSLSICNSIT